MNITTPTTTDRACSQIASRIVVDHAKPLDQTTSADLLLMVSMAVRAGIEHGKRTGAKT